MKYIRTNNGVEKLQDNEFYVVKDNGAIISDSYGEGSVKVLDTSPEFVKWVSFGRPNSIKDYGVKAIELSHKEYASNYQLSTGTDAVYYDGAGKLTLTVGDIPAIIDGTDKEDLEANIRSDGNCVLKGVSILVSCDVLNSQSIIDTGLEALNSCELELNSALALIENHDETQDLAVYNLIKDVDLTGTNFIAICNDAIGV